MRYRIYFKSNPHTITLPLEEFEKMIGVMNVSTSPQTFYMSGKEHLINCLDISHASVENLNESAASSVVKPLSPEELRTQAKKEHEKLVSDPKALLKGIRNRAEGDGENE